MAVKADDIPVMTYWIWTVKNSQEDLLLSYNTEISTPIHLDAYFYYSSREWPVHELLSSAYLLHI